MCGELREAQIGQQVVLSGWVFRVRNLGALLFVDLKDRTGVTQVVAETTAPAAIAFEGIKAQSTVRITGTVIKRESPNNHLPTGQIEVRMDSVELLCPSEPPPFQMGDDPQTSETNRLRYRFLDLRRDPMQRNIELRSKVIASLRRRMIAQGFLEIQTPILTASSPEGARDYLVPSRRYPGQFYALPQAPQMFKQLLMVAGFERYFQIAPCFRDEDARADRSPGEFYQLDLEMSFVDQDDVFAAVEPVLAGVFEEFANKPSTRPPFPRITYKDAMARFGCDKPDLRNPLEISDASQVFVGSGFSVFEAAIAGGAVVKAIPAPKAAEQSRGWFAKREEFVKSVGGGGLGWVAVTDAGPKGSLAKFFDADRLARLAALTGAGPGDAVVFVCDAPAKATKIASQLRDHLGRELGLVKEDEFRFCWVVDYPMYERNEETGAIDFSHNPFSMPQGGMEALETKDPLDVLAYQYDIVCNGIELSSGAIRNHRPDVMYKAFAIVGYSQEQVETEFPGLLNAFKFGAPPHGGMAPGVDRMVMLLAGHKDIREIITFPLNQNAQDLMMNAPSPVRKTQLKELHLEVAWPPGVDPEYR
jgi:aspartyl-tRNA synthetase